MSEPSSSVTCRSVPEATSATYSDEVPLRDDEKATALPSGDQRGPSSEPVAAWKNASTSSVARSRV